MNPSFHLYQLQKIDSQISSLEHKLKENLALLNENSELIKAQSLFAHKSSEIKSANISVKEIEQKILIKRNKLEQSESSLYAGKIKNPKELQDLQKEIASLKGVINSYEDEQLEQMVLLENLEKELESCNELLSATRVNFEEKQTRLGAAQKEIETEKSKLIVERKISISQINDQLLTIYDDIRKRKSGVAVARVEDQACSLCGTSLTPAECQTAKSASKLVYCSSCGRILYAD